jgi:hypothetical protein
MGGFPTRARRRRRARRTLEEQAVTTPSARSPQPLASRRLSPFYDTGPLAALRPVREEQRPRPSASHVATADVDSAAPEEEGTPQAITTPGPSAQGQRREEQDAAHAMQGTLRLEGRTDATFDGGTFHTEDVRARPATGCDGCGECVHITGTLVATYHVTTRVTLPRVSDYPDLTPCQRTRVQSAITNVLAPHEQKHVEAFRKYNGTTRTPLDLTLCRSEFDSTIQSMFDAQEEARRDAVQQASDALDPFYFEVDLDCKD